MKLPMIEVRRFIIHSLLLAGVILAANFAWERPWSQILYQMGISVAVMLIVNVWNPWMDRDADAARKSAEARKRQRGS